ncbi:hypothetical protein B0H66DRAFT_644141 [Apodospora peruviana]|uniref:Glucose-methanol-choline oxidoreductase N-terminal domain-containing protein n=1 Tax=Apodospora peruviana TaxID=516989 RepID=A0AAE0HUY0_9PEZI|nr:hypothetical protein B0H66DRAFT_644141 [Apodospora peruviana]
MASSETPFDQLDKPFDYIVVGGGTAGLVVANRLTEDSHVRVLVVEAGADRSSDPFVLTPGLVPAVYGKDEYDWNFKSPPQSTLNNRPIIQPRGKMLGGSSGLNFMMLLYPGKGIIDAWAALGNSGWDYDSLAPYFRKFATVHAPSQATQDIVGLTYHNEGLAAGDGPIQVSFGEGYGPNNKAWMSAFAELGLEVSTDPRSGNAIGAFQNPASIDPKTKTRSYAGNTYYSPEVAKRANLVVLTETVVSKILFDTTSADVIATGVQVVTKDGVKKQVSASHEVILAAGAIQTPQILELSGVGSKDLLEKHGVSVVIENPSVGENMQDHAIVVQSFEVADGVTSGDVLRDPNVLEALVGMYQASGDGPMGQSTISVAYAPLVDGSGLVAPEAKAEFFKSHETSLSSPGQKAVRSLLESPNGTAFQYLLFPTQSHSPANPASMADYLALTEPENFITIMTVLNHPFSRGSVHITSGEVGAAPLWDPKFHQNEVDLEVLARGVQFVERIVAPTSPFGKLLKTDGRRLPEIVADDLEKAKEIIRERQISVYHLSGSCSMLPRDQGGVVDERLRVYGAKNLRIVDASVFPLEPSGNIQSTVYAVAEKAADIIKEDHAAAVKAV